MNDTSFLFCIRVHARSQRFAGELQNFLNTLISRAEAFSYAELQILSGESEQFFYWMGDEQPDTANSLAALSSTEELDVRLNLCSDADCVTDALDGLTACLADGAYSDCVRVCTLIRDGDDARLFLSGMREGSFCHGFIPFSEGMDGIPDDMCWNSCTHTARFSFPESALDDAWDLSDLLEERIEEIDFDFSQESGTLTVHSIQLPDSETVEAYRAILEQLSGISDNAHISGSLTPEAENAFALLRFVLTDGCVTVQTAIAEI